MDDDIPEGTSPNANFKEIFENIIDENPSSSR
jgi:hypothetical protein